MREKSSSVLTSFSRRKPLRCAVSSLHAHPGPERPARLRQHVLERPEHQRQRRAEFVADVGEERGLRAVEFGQRLGPAPRLGVGVRVGKARRDLAGDQPKEAS